MGHRWGGQSVMAMGWPADPNAGVASAVRLRERLGLPTLTPYTGADLDQGRLEASTVAVSTIGLRARLGLRGAG